MTEPIIIAWDGLVVHVAPEKNRHWHGSDLILTALGSDVSVEVDYPDADDLADGVLARLTVRESDVAPAQAAVLAKLVACAAFLAETFNEGSVAAIKEAKRRIAEKEAERERPWLVLLRQREERKERCMMEFADEPVRVRARGYKSVVRAVMRVREVMERGHYDDQGAWVEPQGTGEYVPHVEYVHENDWQRPTDIKDIRRLEVKQGSRFQVVWDDGREDLPYYDQGAQADNDNKIKPYRG